MKQNSQRIKMNKPIMPNIKANTIKKNQERKKNDKFKDSHCVMPVARKHMVI